jgi:hypothetical protein
MDTNSGPRSARSDSHQGPVLLSRAGFRRAPKFPCDPSEKAPNVGKPMLQAGGATSGLRYKFSTGPKRTGQYRQPFSLLPLGGVGRTRASTVPRLKSWYKRERAAVAQMDRARASEARGREFESPQPHHLSTTIRACRRVSRRVALIFRRE